MYRNLIQSITTFALAIGLVACSGDDGTTGGSGSTSAGSSTGSSSTGGDSSTGSTSGSTSSTGGSSTGSTGSSSTGGASTGTDTGTGTTGGANACEACVLTQCAAEVDACAADQVCACWQECFMQPGSTEESCTMECGMPSAAFQDLAACVVSSCTQECQ